MAGLHGSLRSARARNHSGARLHPETARLLVRRLAERTLHRRPGAAARQRSPIRPARRNQSRIVKESWREKDDFHLPHCVRTIGEDWRQAGAHLTIEHHSEYLARHAHRLPASPSGRRVVFHDPCYLGRYRGIYDAPRAVIARSENLIDPPRARERSFCCGAGGGLAFLGEESGQRVNETRTEELLATGADIIAAACPFCNTMFRDALAKTAAAKPAQLLDIAQLAAAQLPPPQS